MNYLYAKWKNVIQEKIKCSHFKASQPKYYFFSAEKNQLDKAGHRCTHHRMNSVNAPSPGILFPCVRKMNETMLVIDVRILKCGHYMVPHPKYCFLAARETWTRQCWSSMKKLSNDLDTCSLTRNILSFRQENERGNAGHRCKNTRMNSLHAPSSKIKSSKKKKERDNAGHP